VKSSVQKAAEDAMSEAESMTPDAGRMAQARIIPVRSAGRTPSAAAQPERNGTQMVERAAAMLRVIASGGRIGLQLTEIARRCDLKKSTAHRILMCLVRERLVRKRGDRRYVPGDMLFELGLSAMPERRALQHATRTALQRLSRETGAVAGFFFRSRDDCVCADRAGMTCVDAVANGLDIFPGARTPLVLTAGGAAILAAMPRVEAIATLERNLDSMKFYTCASVEGVRRMMHRAFHEGVVVNAGDIVPGINAIGMALADSAGEPYAAISVGGDANSFLLDRLDEYRDLLHAVVAEFHFTPANDWRLQEDIVRIGLRRSVR
jgi:DNA-binding IclR family transcriptional regulator